MQNIQPYLFQQGLSTHRFCITSIRTLSSNVRFRIPQAHCQVYVHFRAGFFFTEHPSELMGVQPVKTALSLVKSLPRSSARFNRWSDSVVFETPSSSPERICFEGLVDCCSLGHIHYESVPKESKMIFIFLYMYMSTYMHRALIRKMLGSISCIWNLKFH